MPAVVASLEAFAPLAPERRELLARLLDGLDPPALAWLAGYTAGLIAPRAAPAVVAAAPDPANALTIVYGSQTGNAKRLAESLQQQAIAAGTPAHLQRTSEVSLKDLARASLAYIVISTQGDGDPPDDARAFVEALLSKRAPRLEKLRYAVLGLGDASYPKFNHVARLVDDRLAELGATRVLERGECDVDFESVATPWRARALGHARESLDVAPLATVTPLRPAVALPSRDRPHGAALLANQRITGRGSRKDVRHLELDLSGSGLRYEPGDALGVWHRNPPALVDEVIALLGLDRSLADTLATERELTRLSRSFLVAHAERARDANLAALLADAARPALAELLKTHQLVDVLARWPAPWHASELVAALRPLVPRLYSIASSQRAVGDEAHITVAVVDYEAHGRRHHGAASRWLADRADGETVRVYVEPNERFRLPADASRDVIMIGPGTGVAPFRAFVQDRAETGASGRNWLFFGEQHVDETFLYQAEWQDALKRGSLARLDLAFSRDQAERIYVQQRIRENGRDVYAWLEGGAHLYVCGDATRMAPDVHRTLVDVVAAARGGDRDAAEEFLATLAREGRYARDVY